MITQKIKIWAGLFLLTIVMASGLGFAYGDQSTLYRGLEPLSEVAHTSAMASTLTAEDALTTVPLTVVPIAVTVSLPTPPPPPTVELAPPCISVIKDGKITGCATKNTVSCKAQGKLTYIGEDTATLKHGQCIGN